MAKKLLKAVGNAKTRTLLLFFGGIVIVGLGIAVNSMSGGGDSNQARTSKTSAVPSNIESVPGAKTSEKYRELQLQRNKSEAEAAKKSGRSSVATLVSDDGTGSGGRYGRGGSGLSDEFLKNAYNQANSGSGGYDPNSKDAQYQKFLDEQRRLQKEQEDRLRKQREAQEARLEQERLAAEARARQQQIEKLAGSMQTSAQEAVAYWAYTPQAFIQGDHAGQAGGMPAADGTTVNSEGVVTPDGAAAGQPKEVLVKAGTVNFAVVDTALNSDEPGPILGTVVSGPFKGAKVLGDFTLPKDGEKVILRFNLLSSKDFANSISINAVAVDPHTARTALASDVDHHYFLRWGSLFASTFMEGYSKAVAETGSTKTEKSNGDTQTDTPALTGKQQFYQGLGAMGEAWAQATSKNFDTPPTVTVNQGTGIGLLFLADVGPDGLMNQGEDSTLQAVSGGGNQTATPVAAALNAGVTQAQQTAINAVTTAANIAGNLAGGTTGTQSSTAAPVAQNATTQTGN